MWKSKAEANATWEQKSTHHKCRKSFHCSAPMKPKMPRTEWLKYKVLLIFQTALVCSLNNNLF